MPLVQELPGDDRDAATNPERFTDVMLRLTIGSTPPAARDAILTYLGSHGGKINRETATGVLLLISALPEYQLC
jgi:hypothetical protein